MHAAGKQARTTQQRSKREDSPPACSHTCLPAHGAHRHVCTGAAVHARCTRARPRAPSEPRGARPLPQKIRDLDVRLARASAELEQAAGCNALSKASRRAWRAATRPAGRSRAHINILPFHGGRGPRAAPSATLDAAVILARRGYGSSR